MNHIKKHSNGNEFENYKCFRYRIDIEFKHNLFDTDFDALKEENGHKTYIIVQNVTKN